MRNILAAILGFIVASVITYIIEKIGHSVYPMPDVIDPMDMESIKQNVHLISTGSMLFVITAHAIGTLSGMFAAGFISKTSLIPAYIVGAIMILATIANLVMIPSPTWFTITDLAGVLMAFFVGKFLALKQIKVKS